MQPPPFRYVFIATGSIGLVHVKNLVKCSEYRPLILIAKTEKKWGDMPLNYLNLKTKKKERQEWRESETPAYYLRMSCAIYDKYLLWIITCTNILKKPTITAMARYIGHAINTIIYISKQRNKSHRYFQYFDCILQYL